MVKRGDAYAVDGRIIRFYQNDPPAPVVIVTRGGPAAGYQERTLCQVELDVTAWAAAAADTDELLSLAVPAVLRAFIGLNTITLGWDDAGFRLRFLGVVASLTGIERDSEAVAAANWVRATARFMLQGELELMVAAGTAEAMGKIQDVRYKTRIIFSK